MADKEIGDLTDGGALASGDLIHVVRSGNSRKAAVGAAAGPSTPGLMSGPDKAKLDLIESGADVTDATNVAAAGAVMDGDFSADGIMVRTGAGAYASRTLVAGNGLTGSDLDGDTGNPSLAVGAGTGITVNADDVAIDKASDANVAAAASNKVLTADLIESASAEVALGSNTIAIDWDAGFNFARELSGNGTVSNPSNGQPGTYRTLRLYGNSGTDRSITSWGNQFSAQGLPTLTDIDNTQQYEVTIKCITASWFSVVQTRRIDPP